MIIVISIQYITYNDNNDSRPHGDGRLRPADQGDQKKGRQIDDKVVRQSASKAGELINSAKSHSRGKSYTAMDLATGANEIVSVIVKEKKGDQIEDKQ